MSADITTPPKPTTKVPKKIVKAVRREAEKRAAAEGQLRSLRTQLLEAQTKLTAQPEPPPVAPAPPPAAPSARDTYRKVGAEQGPYAAAAWLTDPANYTAFVQDAEARRAARR